MALNLMKRPKEINGDNKIVMRSIGWKESAVMDSTENHSNYNSNTFSNKRTNLFILPTQYLTHIQDYKISFPALI